MLNWLKRLFSRPELPALPESLLQDILSPGTFDFVRADVYVAYSGTPEETHTHVSILIPHEERISLLQPGISVLMAMYCQTSGDGFEAALDRLNAGAMQQAGKIQKMRLK